MTKHAALLLALAIGACATQPAPSPPTPSIDVDPLVAVRAQRSLELLVSYLVGQWNTVEQPAGQGDSTPMRLRIARIWPERAGEYWFYEEYVDQNDDRRVLRQRIFRLVREDTTLRAVMYRLPGDPAAYAGEWRKPRPFAALAVGNLQEAKGCSVVWQAQLEAYFAAGTAGRECRGEGPGVAYEHSEYYLGSSSMRLWIQGLDASGKQVAGLTGPSEFRRISEKLT